MFEFGNTVDASVLLQLVRMTRSSELLICGITGCLVGDVALLSLEKSSSEVNPLVKVKSDVLALFHWMQAGVFWVVLLGLNLKFEIQIGGWWRVVPWNVGKVLAFDQKWVLAHGLMALVLGNMCSDVNLKIPMPAWRKILPCAGEAGSAMFGCFGYSITSTLSVFSGRLRGDGWPKGPGLFLLVGTTGHISKAYSIRVS